MRSCIAAAVSRHLHDNMPEQPVPVVQLLPKPKYSSLPEHDGKKLVMVIAEDSRTALLVAALLECQPEFVIASSQSGEAAMQELEALPYLPNCILLAKRLPGITGRQVGPCDIVISDVTNDLGQPWHGQFWLYVCPCHKADTAVCIHVRHPGLLECLISYLSIEHDAMSTHYGAFML